MDRMIKWPESEVTARTSRRSYFLGSAICKRGHVETTEIKPSEPLNISPLCVTCGAEVLVACPGCGCRLRGSGVTPGRYYSRETSKKSFCDLCGYVYPWATKLERIYELENRLDQEEIDPADKVAIREQLLKLQAPEVSAEQEKRIWQTIKDKAGNAIGVPAVKDLLEGIVSRVVREAIGI